MKKLAMGLAAAFMVTGAQAATISFNSNSGTYSNSGVTATVTVTGGSRYYSSTENAIGIGNSALNGAIGSSGVFGTTFVESETMTVTFSQEVILDTVWFRQWENKVLCCGDEVHFDYTGGASGTGSLLFSNSGLGDGPLLDPFAAGVRLTSFTIRPEQDGLDGSGNGASNDTAVYLHSVDFSIPPPEVPLPAAAWLFGSALLGLGAAGRRRRQAA